MSSSWSKQSNALESNAPKTLAPSTDRFHFSSIFSRHCWVLRGEEDLFWRVQEEVPQCEIFQKSVFLQILYQSLLPSNITLLHFLAQILYTLFKRSLLKCKFFRNLSARVKTRQIPHVNFKRQVNSSSNFASFFIVMKHISSVNFRLIHFLLWIKGSHHNSKFEIFEISGKNSSNSSWQF